MGKSKPSSEPFKGERLLRDVSRSFYLSLRLLPAAMRPVASLGYLLARTTDTIADTEGLKTEVRRSLLERLRGYLLDKIPEEQAKKNLVIEIQEDLLPTIKNRGERRLIENLEECLDWLSGVDPTKRYILNEVLDAITQGQIFDLERFGTASSEHPAFLRTAGQLVQYADWVAGSVGRFWTELAKVAVPDFAADSVEVMLKRSESYGRGLQWLNIIRDLNEDLRMGRCYLPLNELTEAGWRDQETWKNNQAALMEVASNWMDRVETALRDGLHYSQSMRSRRLQLASVLPALIGARTLRELRKSQSGYLAKRVKISRAEVRGILVGAIWSVYCRRPLDRYFQKLLYA